MLISYMKRVSLLCRSPFSLKRQSECESSKLRRKRTISQCRKTTKRTSRTKRNHLLTSPSVTNWSATSDFVHPTRSPRVRLTTNHAVSRDPSRPFYSWQFARSLGTVALVHTQIHFRADPLLKRAPSRSKFLRDRLVSHRQASGLRPVLTSLTCPNLMLI